MSDHQKSIIAMDTMQFFFLFYILFRICKRVRRSLADINICLDITDITGMKTEKKTLFLTLYEYLDIVKYLKQKTKFFDICLVKFDFTCELKIKMQKQD